MSNLQVHLVGPLRVVCELRGDVTPRGRRAQAMIALLALSPAHERGRAWLQAKLWSDRSPEQASASLRQELCRLRCAIGDEHIASDYQRVRLVDVRVDLLDMLDVEAFHCDFGAGEPPDLLEGLEINDEEFEEWLRAERASWHDLVAAASRQIRQSKMVSSSDDLQWLGIHSRESLQNTAGLAPTIDPPIPGRPLPGRKFVTAALAEAHGADSRGRDDPVVIELYQEKQGPRRAVTKDVPVELAARMRMESVSGRKVAGIEIVLTNGRRMIVNSGVDPNALARVLAVLERS
jgi:hypothetical protein